MNVSQLWVWFVAGMVPYYIHLKPVIDGGRTLEVRAAYWFATVRLHQGGSPQWMIRVPLIERLQRAFWAVVMRPPEDKALPE
jgi:hypothetical protein